MGNQELQTLSQNASIIYGQIKYLNIPPLPPIYKNWEVLAYNPPYY